MKLHTQEEVKEAILRLAMCARRDCDVCKHKDRPKAELPSDECKKRATKSMNILADVCMCNVPQPPQTPKRSKKTYKGYGHETICWECAKNGGLCSWSENFTPVENWKAVPTKIQARGHADNVNTVDSYDVYECPEFELMERLKNKRKEGLM